MALLRLATRGSAQATAQSTAVADAQKNCRLNGIANCRFVPGDIQDCLPGLDARPEVVVIDAALIATMNANSAVRPVNVRVKPCMTPSF